MKELGLAGRHHNTDGQISQKHGNTKIEKPMATTLLEVFAPMPC
jgi:hypothetical protein